MLAVDHFPYGIEKHPTEGFLCRFPDFPEFTPTGPTIEKLLAGLQDGIIPVIEARLKEKNFPKTLRHPAPGEEYFFLSPTFSVKLQLIQTVRLRKITPHELARRMGCYPQEATRILKFSHPTKIDTLNAAIEALGARLSCQVELITDRLPEID